MDNRYVTASVVGWFSQSVRQQTHRDPKQPTATSSDPREPGTPSTVEVSTFSGIFIVKTSKQSRTGKCDLCTPEYIGRPCRWTIYPPAKSTDWQLQVPIHTKQLLVSPARPKTYRIQEVLYFGYLVRPLNPWAPILNPSTRDWNPKGCKGCYSPSLCSLGLETSA